MSKNYPALSSIALGNGSRCARPQDFPELVQMSSPALAVMTDFTKVRAVTTTIDVNIRDALEIMKVVGIRLLLVVDTEKRIIGLITATDIQGEKALKVREQRGVAHNELSVGELMTPQKDITVMNLLSVRNAQVGHIVQTMKELERQHTLVVEIDGETGEQSIRGLFSTTQINDMLLDDISEDLPAAHSLAEMQRELH